MLVSFRQCSLNEDRPSDEPQPKGRMSKDCEEVHERREIVAYRADGGYYARNAQTFEILPNR